MQIDLDLMKKMLNVFIDSPKAFIKLTELDAAINDKESLYFHIGLMLDNKFITGADFESKAKSIGLTHTSAGMDIRPLLVRLSQRGHDFAVMLNQQPILEKLKEQAKQAPMDVLVAIGKAWGRKLISRHLDLDI
ncbi:DUF2513 domain-containing protein [Klebsiella pneumoniae]|uniref:DUF2513 domain-containing protein n=1 Tax=Klebsiella pneumoniae TaxID=573 RepID=UPI0023F8475C|nr:DUF2513 domain-containing protein [Klebsiella pneumoniae]MDF7739708.1 DUF2513 domain-containing protein [Klebsiella pneumoniae]HDT4781683.1 DUF2513 domain-containing protein [Klebsiella pneumoniae subsp. pneumoniae]HDT4786563.1 DUF2513 domain-containing protein [Klebsiella pneumoniae]